MSGQQPTTGAPCCCRPGNQRDNCRHCEGTGLRVDFAALRAQTIKPKTFRIDTGDSNDGTAGFVAYVDAATPEAALEKLRARVQRDEYMVEDEPDFKVCVYLNADNVKLEEVEEEDDGEES